MTTDLLLTLIIPASIMGGIFFVMLFIVTRGIEECSKDKKYVRVKTKRTKIKDESFEQNGPFEHCCPVCGLDHNKKISFCSDKCYVYAMEDIYNLSLMEDI